MQRALLLSVLALASVGCDAHLMHPVLFYGDSQACVEESLAKHDDDGDGGRTWALAHAQFESACLDGHDAAACSALGVMLEQGRGVEVDIAQAVALYQRACDDENARGCYHLGRAHVSGYALDANVGVAMGLFESSCKRGVEAACRELASLWVTSGGPGDVERASELFEHSCDQGDVRSCYELGVMVAGGEMTRDDFRAYTLLEKACVHSIDDSCARLALIQARMVALRDVHANRH